MVTNLVKLIHSARYRAYLVSRYTADFEDTVKNFSVVDLTNEVDRGVASEQAKSHLDRKVPDVQLVEDGTDQ